MCCWESLKFFYLVLAGMQARSLKRKPNGLSWKQGKLGCLCTSLKSPHLLLHTGLSVQNVDRLHHKANSKHILELHGTTHRYASTAKDRCGPCRSMFSCPFFSRKAQVLTITGLETRLKAYTLARILLIWHSAL